MNKQYANIKFSKEKSKGGKLPFLDILINSLDKVTTSVYQKPNFTRLFMNLKCFVSRNYKFNLIKTLLDKIFKINNTLLGFDLDIKNLKHCLLHKNFHEKIVAYNVKKFLNNKIRNSNIEEENVEKHNFMLPYKKWCKLDKSVRHIFSTITN